MTEATQEMHLQRTAWSKERLEKVNPAGTSRTSQHCNSREDRVVHFLPYGKESPTKSRAVDSTCRLSASGSEAVSVPAGDQSLNLRPSAERHFNQANGMRPRVGSSLCRGYF